MVDKRKTYQDAVQEHMRWLTGQGKAANTLKSVRQTLDALGGVLKNQTGRADMFTYNINHKHITALFMSKAWGDRTFNLHKGNLVRFFEWCRVVGYMPRDVDPMYGITSRKPAESDKQRIPLTEWPRLFLACKHPEEEMIIALGLYLFLRGSEMAAIQIQHVRLGERRIKIWRKKTKKFDDMPISAELDAALRTYLTWYGQTYGPLHADWYLVPARLKGNHSQARGGTGRFGHLLGHAPMDPAKQISRPYNYVSSILARAGYDTDGEGAHTLRRSGARALFDELRKTGYDGALRRVMSMLDHTNSKVTEIYLGLRLEKMQRDEEIEGAIMFPSLVEVMAGYEGRVMIDSEKPAPAGLKVVV